MEVVAFGQLRPQLCLCTWSLCTGLRIQVCARIRSPRIGVSVGEAISLVHLGSRFPLCECVLFCVKCKPRSCTSCWSSVFARSTGLDERVHVHLTGALRSICLFLSALIWRRLVLQRAQVLRALRRRDVLCAMSAPPLCFRCPNIDFHVGADSSAQLVLCTF